jgi:large subunit ribosomal protein L24
MGLQIKKDDTVVVITGRDKGTTGTVLKVLRDEDRVIVQGVNRVKRHQKPTPKQPEGGIVEKEAAIHVSNVALVDSKGDAPTRVRMGKDKDGRKVRVAAKSGTVLDK